MRVKARANACALLEYRHREALAQRHEVPRLGVSVSLPRSSAFAVGVRQRRKLSAGVESRAYCGASVRRRAICDVSAPLMVPLRAQPFCTPPDVVTSLVLRSSSFSAPLCAPPAASVLQA